MADPIPEPVQAALDAVERGDEDAFVSAFADDGSVDDNGRTFLGHDAIRRWSAAEFIGLGGKLAIRDVRRTDDGAVVDADFSSSGFNGFSSFAFVVGGGAVRSMRISE